MNTPLPEGYQYEPDDSDLEQESLAAEYISHIKRNATCTVCGGICHSHIQGCPEQEWEEPEEESPE